MPPEIYREMYYQFSITPRTLSVYQRAGRGLSKKYPVALQEFTAFALNVGLDVSSLSTFFDSYLYPAAMSVY